MVNISEELSEIDKKIPTPLYYQLMQILKYQIESHKLKPGDSIPTEHELMERFGISRATVRQAVLQLVTDGYLHREKSKGTFVTTPPSKFRFIEGLKGFSSEMNSRGISYFSKVLLQNIIPASEKVADRLAISVGDRVFHIHRLRYVNDRPFLIDHHYISYDMVPGIEGIMADQVSLYHVLETDYHIYLHHGWREFEPVGPSNKEEIELLDIYSTTKLLYVESVLSDKKNTPVDYFEATIHGKFTVDILNANE